MRRGHRHCPRCALIRPISIFKPKSDICNKCVFGDFRSPIREYNTPIHMRLAVVFAKVPLTAGGIVIALQQMQELPPPEQLEAL